MSREGMSGESSDPNAREISSLFADAEASLESTAGVAPTYPNGPVRSPAARPVEPAEPVESREPSIWDEPDKVDPGVSVPRRTIVVGSGTPSASPPAGPRWGRRTLPADEGSGTTPAPTPPAGPNPYRPSPLPRMGPVTRVGPGGAYRSTPPDDEEIIRPSVARRVPPTEPLRGAPRPVVVAAAAIPNGARAVRTDANTEIWLAGGPEPAEKVKIKWNAELVKNIAKNGFKTYVQRLDFRNKSRSDIAWLITGVGTAFIVENLIGLGTTKLAKACIGFGLSEVALAIASTKTTERELYVIKNFNGDEMNRKLSELATKRQETEMKIRSAIKNFVIGSSLEFLAQGLFEAGVGVGMHIGELGVVGAVQNLPQGLTSGPETSGWDIRKLHPFGIGAETPPVAEPTPAIAPDLQPTRGVVRVVPQPAAATVPPEGEGAAVPGAPAVPANVPGPAEAGPSAPSVPFPAAEAAAATPDQAAFIKELRAVTNNGMISDKDFADTLIKHQTLQEQVSAQVGSHLDLTDRIAQSDLEAYANQVFKKQILESLRSGESLDSAMQKAAAFYHNSIDNFSPGQLQPEIVAEITKEVPLDTVKEVVVPDHSSVGHLAEAAGHHVDWSPSGLHYTETVDVFRAEAILNHDKLETYYHQLADRGFLGEHPDPFPSIDQINADADLALNGDQAAFKRLVEALHWEKAGDTFYVPTPDQVKKIVELIRRLKRP